MTVDHRQACFFVSSACCEAASPIPLVARPPVTPKATGSISFLQKSLDWPLSSDHRSENTETERQKCCRQSSRQPDRHSHTDMRVVRRLHFVVVFHRSETLLHSLKREPPGRRSLRRWSMAAARARRGARPGRRATAVGVFPGAGAWTSSPRLRACLDYKD